MGDGTAVNGNLDEVFLCSLDAFGDSCLNFVGFAETPAHDAVFITDYDDCGEGEGATALSHLGNAVDSDQTVFEFEVAGRFYFVVFGCHSRY